jgi:hypothetical protein
VDKRWFVFLIELHRTRMQRGSKLGLHVGPPHMRQRQTRLGNPVRNLAGYFLALVDESPTITVTRWLP